MFKVDQKFPDFELEAYFPAQDKVGKINSKSFKEKWLIILFYPADFTFVCPTELADLNKFYSDFKKYKSEVLVVSTDTVFTHKAWLDVEKLLSGVRYPMAADHNGSLSKVLDVYDERNGMAQRAAFIVDPNGILRSVDIVSDSIGRSASELLRKLKALNFVKSHPGNVCPLSWEETGTLQPSIKKAGKVYKEYHK